MTKNELQARRDKKNRSGNATMNEFLNHQSNIPYNSATDANESSTIADQNIVVAFSDSTNLSNRQVRPVLANLDADDDDDDDGYDSGGDDGVNEANRDSVKGIQQEYLQNVHSQLKLECNSQRGKQSEDWLVDYLKENGWWIRKEHATRIAKKLTLTAYHYSYYRDVRVWLPDLQYGNECKPCCPCCKSKSKVTVHGFHSKHHGRMIIGLNERIILFLGDIVVKDAKKRTRH